MNKEKILVTGATGYVGGRLVPRLLDLGYPVRALVRSAKKIEGRYWAKHENLEICEGDLFDLDTLQEAAQGCSAAYYLVHSMDGQGRAFASKDAEAARNMVIVAEREKLKRIIYLSGLGDPKSKLSEHLRSRQEVGEILKAGSVPVTILRAGMIIGSGSASFEIMRYLVERLPVMLTPRWVNTPCQPIAIRNVLNYLIGCLEVKETEGETFDIGGPEVSTYQEMMNLYAEEAGLPKRFIVSLPFFTAKLSSYWVEFITPIPRALTRPLAEGLINPVLCQEERIRALIPQELFTCREAMQRALMRMKLDEVETHWTDAGSFRPPEWTYSGDPDWSGGNTFYDCRRIELAASATEIWPILTQIGDKNGWYYGDWLWQLRGMIDKLIGGVGLGRGRRSGGEPRVGDVIDFWRVARVEQDRHLVLQAEMKLPGEALLEFRLKSLPNGHTELGQIARFRPRGLTGLAYWYAVTPLHYFVFNGMLRGIAKTLGGEILRGPEEFRPELDEIEPLIDLRDMAEKRP